jgi:hypothetical protein
MNILIFIALVSFQSKDPAATLIEKLGNQQKAAPVYTETPETAEHKFLAAKLKQAESEFQKISPDTDCEQYARGSDGKVQCLKAVLAVLHEVVILKNALARQLEAVDSCTKLYRQTIDKKQSDLTVRESQAVKACTTLDLYPLDMPAPPK